MSGAASNDSTSPVTPSQNTSGSLSIANITQRIVPHSDIQDKHRANANQKQSKDSPVLSEDGTENQSKSMIDPMDVNDTDDDKDDEDGEDDESEPEDVDDSGPALIQEYSPAYPGKYTKHFDTKATVDDMRIFHLLLKREMVDKPSKLLALRHLEAKREAGRKLTQTLHCDLVAMARVHYNAYYMEVLRAIAKGSDKKAAQVILHLIPQLESWTFSSTEKLFVDCDQMIYIDRCCPKVKHRIKMFEAGEGDNDFTLTKKSKKLEYFNAIDAKIKDLDIRMQRVARPKAEAADRAETSIIIELMPVGVSFQYVDARLHVPSQAEPETPQENPEMKIEQDAVSSPPAHQTLDEALKAMAQQNAFVNSLAGDFNKQKQRIADLEKDLQSSAELKDEIQLLQSQLENLIKDHSKLHVRHSNSSSRLVASEQACNNLRRENETKQKENKGIITRYLQLQEVNKLLQREISDSEGKLTQLEERVEQAKELLAAD
ncbi:hypothetical protein BJ170DRAFT_592900 [Xylariales sp. AK1849]|nr:hypothetical protein BJ170DRAFT_592900 [Xylariales sp. AK1849]